MKRGVTIVPLEEALKGSQADPDKERGQYLNYLDYVLDRLDVTEKYRDAFIKITGFDYRQIASLKEINALGKPLQIHIQSAEVAIHGQ